MKVKTKSLLAIVCCIAIAAAGFFMGCQPFHQMDETRSITQTDAGNSESTSPDAGTTDSSSSEPVTDSSASNEGMAPDAAGNSETTQDAGTTDTGTAPDTTSEPTTDAGSNDSGATDNMADDGPDSNMSDSQAGDSSGTDNNTSDSSNQVRPRSHTNRSNAYNWCKKIPKFSDHCPATAPTDLNDPSQVRFIPHIEESNHPDGSPWVRNFVVAFPNNNCPVVVAPLKNGIPKDCSNRYVNHVVFETRVYKDDGIQDISKKEITHWILSGSKADQLLAEPCYQNTFLKPAPTGGKYVKDIDAKNTNDAHLKCFGKTLGVKKGDVPYHLLWNGRPLP